jgi:acyl carrier protein
MSPPAPVRPELGAMLAAMAHPALDPAGLTDETPLFEGGLALDSVDVLEVVVLLEERFGVAVSAEQVVGEEFATFGRLVAFVTERCAQAARAGG